MKELKKTQCRKVLKIASRIYPYKVYVRSEAHTKYMGLGLGSLII
jgi:hypothetical protein